eukprot:8477173-Alexandrium_andersonii.AAC.1
MVSASLVGSEMCIRDSHPLPSALAPRAPLHHADGRQRGARFLLPLPAVSYTHLTLPTICSV